MTSPPTDPTNGPQSERDVTLLLGAVAEGRPGADAELLAIIYRDLRAIAGSYFRSQGPEHTLQPTALVHEAFLRMVGNGKTPAEGRAHFIAIAATAMRQILIDHARRKRADKRGGDAGRVTLSGLMLDEGDSSLDALDVHEKLNRLAEIDPRQARIVELRFFAGLRVPEIALVMGVSDRTVEMDWRMARAWLRRELEESSP